MTLLRPWWADASWQSVTQPSGACYSLADRPSVTYAPPSLPGTTTRDLMPNLVLLRGAPGSGKTSVGSTFADRFGWRFVELDEIKRSRGDVMVFDPGAFSEAGRQAKLALDAGD